MPREITRNALALMFVLTLANLAATFTVARQVSRLEHSVVAASQAAATAATAANVVAHTPANKPK